ncbi:MAG: hypothetical protein LBQ52_10775 [Helicobacteraceae bacterium]|jgi:hypothetical protein|nr:hypothetical protein [Helicobacteraceae bacterium]
MSTTAQKSYSLETDIIDGIREIADRLGKKQSQIIKEAFALYVRTLESDDDDDRYEINADFARKCKESVEAFESGKAKVWTQAQIEALYNV